VHMAAAERLSAERGRLLLTMTALQRLSISCRQGFVPEIGNLPCAGTLASLCIVCDLPQRLAALDALPNLTELSLNQFDAEPSFAGAHLTALAKLELQRCRGLPLLAALLSNSSPRCRNSRTSIWRSANSATMLAERWRCSRSCGSSRSPKWAPSTADGSATSAHFRA
jgi:hypothetical protein